MRLLNTTTYEIHEFQSENENRQYAILSHTWGDDECTFQYMSTRKPLAGIESPKPKGYKKIKYCCEQAVRDGLEWAWVDTCCIDKTSTAELSEAINSMFRWYRDATICYAYLVDVDSYEDISGSRWFTRGWTLQELIAPRVIRFYSANWSDLGSKLDLQDKIEKITGIEKVVLSTGKFDEVCIAKRMSWAAYRQTTRVEDIAYSLLGIFEVNMPLLYGEGKRSFLRLQEEIMKISDDHTLFAWGLPEELVYLEKSDMESWTEYGGVSHSQPPLSGLLASSPSEFVTEHDLRPLQTLLPDMPPIMSSNGVRIELRVWSKDKLSYQFAAISCYVHGHNTRSLGIPLLRWSARYTARCGPLVLLSEVDWSAGETEILLVKQPQTAIPSLPDPRSFQIVRTSERDGDYFTIDEIFCLPSSSYSHHTHSISFPTDRKGPHAVLFFKQTTNFQELLFKRHLILGKITPGNSGYKIEEAAGYSFVPPFAIVLGSSGDNSEYWAAFVPILSETDTQGDFHKLLHDRKHLIKYCTTKTQLKQRLDNGDEMDLAKSDHLDMCLHRIISTWTPLYKGASKKRWGVWGLFLCLKLLVRPANFAETAVFVCVDISLRRLEAESGPIKISESHQAHFSGNWWDALELKGFSGVPQVSKGGTSNDENEIADLRS